MLTSFSAWSCLVLPPKYSFFRPTRACTKTILFTLRQIKRHCIHQITTKQPFLFLWQQFILLLHREFELHGRFADGCKILPGGKTWVADQALIQVHGGHLSHSVVFRKKRDVETKEWWIPRTRDFNFETTSKFMADICWYTVCILLVSFPCLPTPHLPILLESLTCYYRTRRTNPLGT